MKIVVGLGNPGKKYEKTRHNVGFLTVDYIPKNVGGFSDWQLKKKLKSKVSENKELKILLAKPQTFMNSSGEAVKKMLTDYKLPTTALTVVHDDFDLPLGTFKFESDRGSAGHKGVRSIIDALGTKDFWRLRIGIRPPHLETNLKADAFVLKNFSKGEKEIIKKTIAKAVENLFE
jgi:PTH1 family peptidyl-tRNA hydrolase